MNLQNYRRPRIGLAVWVYGIFASMLVTGVLSHHFKLQPSPVAIASALRLVTRIQVLCSFYARWHLFNVEDLCIC